MSLNSAAVIILLLHLFLSLPGGNAVDTTVLDTRGHPLHSKSKYYILPVTQGQGGGLAMSPKNSTSFCPLYVTQENQEIYAGLPVWFIPKISKQSLISLSSDLNIIFNTVNICLQSAVWRIIVDHNTRRKYITTGGAIGNPGEATITSWFKIEMVRRGSYENDQYYYKIVFCPTVCPFCMVMCGDVGVFVLEDGTKLLGLTNRPFYVMFKKA